jgi:hypothetical protein
MKSREDAMGHRYSIVSQCMQLLKKSQMPTIKKLRVEILLIQLKRLLLDYDLDKEPKIGPCGEDAFEELLNQMHSICSEDYESEKISELMAKMGSVVTELTESHM